MTTENPSELLASCEREWTAMQAIMKELLPLDRKRREWVLRTVIAHHEMMVGCDDTMEAHE